MSKCMLAPNTPSAAPVPHAEVEADHDDLHNLRFIRRGLLLKRGTHAKDQYTPRSPPSRRAEQPACGPASRGRHPHT